MMFNFEMFLLCDIRITCDGSWCKFQVHCAIPWTRH